MDSNAPKKFPVLALVLGIAVAVVVYAVVSGAGLKKEKSATQGTSTASGKNAGTQKAGWARRSLQDISLDAPFDFSINEEIVSKTPQKLRDATDYMEIYQGQRGEDFVIGVSRIGYKGAITPNLDGATQGAMTATAMTLGDPKPKYSSSTTTLNGFDARRASYQNTVAGRNLQIEGLFVLSGRRLWQVQVIFADPSMAADASRVLKSISVTP